MTGQNRVVWFDIDGTLISYEQSFQSIFESGVGPVSDAVYEEYTTALFQALEDCDPEPYRTAFARTVQDGALVGDPEALAAAYIDAEVAASSVSEAAKSVVGTAAEHGAVGVVTNGAGPVQRRKLANHTLSQHVDSVVVSGEAGLRKPNPELFHVAANRLAGSSHVYVCDDPVTDVRGAAKAGWAPILVGAEPSDGESDPMAVVDSIDEVESVLWGD